MEGRIHALGDLGPIEKVACVFKDFVPPSAQVDVLSPDDNGWKKVVAKLVELAGGEDGFQKATGKDAESFEDALMLHEHEALVQALKMVENAGVFDPPTLFEADAKLIRGWNADTYRDRSCRVYPEIGVPRWPKETSDPLFLKKRKTLAVPRIAALLDVIAPSLTNIQAVRSFIGLPEMSKCSVENEDLQVREVEWHKYLQRVAILLSNDTVRVYDVMNETWDDEMGLIDHEFQRSVACMEWQPLNGFGLALACEHGVCFWNNGLQEMIFLQHSSPVKCLSWSPKGRLLATGSSYVTIWDVATRHPTQLYRHGVETLIWSPSGFHLYAGSSGGGFRIWETKTWSCEVFSDFVHPVQAVSWAGTKNLLVASGEAPDADKGADVTLYAFTFPNEPPVLNGTLVNVRLALSSAIAEEAVLNMASARSVQSIAVNDTGSRMAVCFKEAPGVAIYAAKTHPELSFFHVGFVWGPPAMLPIRISFKPNFEKGALLCVVFEDAMKDKDAQTLVRFVPMYF